MVILYKVKSAAFYIKMLVRGLASDAGRPRPLVYARDALNNDGLFRQCLE